MASARFAHHSPIGPSLILVVMLLLAAHCVAAWSTSALSPDVGASVSGVTWRDMNQDNVRDKDEPGLPDALIVLSDGQGDIVASTLSDEEGNYALVAPTAGQYFLTFRVSGPMTVLTSTYVAVDLSAGPRTVDFPCALYLPGCAPFLGGTVFHDADCDGQLDAGEDALADIPIRLYTLSGDLAGVTHSDKAGHFGVEMHALVPGYVVFDPPTAWRGGPAPLYWSTDFSDCYAGSVLVGFAPGVAPTVTANRRTGQSMLPPEPGVLSGTLCMADGGAPIEGVVVHLYGDDGALADTAVSDDMGSFQFQALEPFATYTLRQEPIPGLAPTTSLHWGIATTSRCEIDLLLPQIPADVSHQAWCPMVAGR